MPLSPRSSAAQLVEFSSSVQFRSVLIRLVGFGFLRFGSHPPSFALIREVLPPGFWGQHFCSVDNIGPAGVTMQLEMLEKQTRLSGFLDCV